MIYRQEECQQECNVAEGTYVHPHCHLTMWPLSSALVEGLAPYTCSHQTYLTGGSGKQKKQDRICFRDSCPGVE